jgi:hypothetical protein
MKIEKFQLCGNNSVCAGEFQLLRGRASAQLRGNVEEDVSSYWMTLRKSEDTGNGKRKH